MINYALATLGYALGDMEAVIQIEHRKFSNTSLSCRSGETAL